MGVCLLFQLIDMYLYFEIELLFFLQSISLYELVFDYFLFGSQPPEERDDGDSSEDSLDESPDEDGLDFIDEGLYELVEDSSDDGDEVRAHDEHESVRKHNAMFRNENDSMEEVRQTDSQLQNESRHLEKGTDKNMDGQEWVIDLVADKSLNHENDHVCTSEDAAILPEGRKNVVNQGSMFTPSREGIFKDTHNVKSGRGESTTCKIEFSDSVIRILYDEQRPADRSRELNEISRKSVTDEERICQTQDDRNEGGGKNREHSMSLESNLSKKDNMTLDIRLRLVSLIENCRFKFKKEKCNNTPPSNHKSRRSSKRQGIKGNSSNDNTQKTKQNSDQSPGDKTQVKKDVKIKFIESLLEQNMILEYNSEITEPLEKHYNQKESLRSMKILEDKACNTETEFLYSTYDRNITVSENTQDTIEFNETKDDDLSIQKGSVFNKTPNISAFEKDTKRNCENELEQDARRGFCSNNTKGDHSIRMSDSQKPLKETGARRKHLKQI